MASPKMSISRRRHQRSPDRRRVPRGGRREGDQAGHHPSLVVADSYDSARTPCVRYLERFGFHVAEAASGDAALALIKTRRPHVILVEDGLPDMPAGRIVQRFQERPGTESIPVIVMASSGETSGEPRAQSAAGVLVKPFTLAAMVQEVRRVLRGQMAAKAVMRSAS